MQTNAVRTTISLPLELHDWLRFRALSERQSLSRLVIRELTERIGKKVGVTAQKKLSRDLALFNKIALSGRRINAVAAVREERSRDNG